MNIDIELSSDIGGEATDSQRKAIRDLVDEAVEREFPEDTVSTCVGNTSETHVRLRFGDDEASRADGVRERVGAIVEEISSGEAWWDAA